MSVLKKLASQQNRKDSVPNQELAAELAKQKDRKGIKEIADNLWHKDKKIQADCLKVLYEIGYIAPELIEAYILDFIHLLSNKNNRLVWGAMIGLSTIADRRPKEMIDNLDQIIKTIENGSVITIDNGIKALSLTASVDKKSNKAIFPFLIEQLSQCRPKSVPQYAEHILVSVTPENKKRYLTTLNKRKDILTSTQRARINRIFKSLET